MFLSVCLGVGKKEPSSFTAVLFSVNRGLFHFHLLDSQNLCLPLLSPKVFVHYTAGCNGVIPRGGGGTSICMHIGYVPRERPPFSALNTWPVRLRLNLTFNLRAPTPSPMGSCGITFFFVMLIYKPPLRTSVGQSKPSYIIAPPTSTAYCLPV